MKLRKKKLIFIILVVVMALIFINVALTPDIKLANVIKSILAWVGIVVAIFGIQLTLGSHDVDTKLRGLKTSVSGFIVYGIAICFDF
jgi:hypothetical protein